MGARSNPPERGRTIAGLLAAAAMCLSAAAVRAQVVDNWTSTSSNLWGTGGNWSVGVPSNANAATFNNSAGLQGNITLLAASSTGTLVFLSTGGATAFTFDTSGTANTNTLTISSGITNSDTAAITFFNTTALGATQTWTNNGGTMTFDGNVTLAVGGPGSALTINGSSAVNIAGIIANGGATAGGLTYGGTGTLTLTGINTFTGATTINSGGNLQLGNGATSGTIASTSGIADSGTLLLDEGPSVVIGAAITGTGGVTQNGAFNVALSGTNTYSGATVVNSSGLYASSASAFGGATGLSAVTINNSGGLFLNGNSNTVGSIASGSATSTVSLGSGTLTTGGNNSSTTFAGIVSGTGGLTEAGTGTLTLTGANTYTGVTTINNGANLQLGNGTTNGTIASTSGIANSGTLLLDENSAVAISKAITGTGGIIMNGSSNTTLSGTNVYSGATTVNGGTLTGGSGSAFGGATGLSAVTVNNSGILALSESNTVGSIASASATSSITLGAMTLTTGGNDTSTTFAGVISGSGGGLTEAGTGTLILDNANTYTGKTTINGGASLQLGNGTTNGTIASTSGIADSGTLLLNENTSATVSAAITGTGGVTENGSVQNTLSGTNVYSGATVINSGGLVGGSTSAFGGSGLSAVTINNSGVLSLFGFNNTIGSLASASTTSAVSLTFGSTLTTGGNNTSTTYAGGISGGAGGILTKVGTGTMTLSGANSYTGATNINGGALSISADNNIGAAPGSATANMLNLNGGTLDTTSSFTLNSNRGVTLNAGGGTFSPSSGTTLTYGGIVAGIGALTVNGPGTVALSGANTYSGATNLTGGTLSIGADNNLGTAPASVTANLLNFNGGTLATTATFALNSNRGVTVTARGGTLSAGSGTTLTYGGLIAGTGSLALPGAGTVNLTNNALSFGGSATVTSGTLEFSGTLPSIGTLTLGTGSTLLLSGSDLSVTNLVISGNAIIDFGSSASILNTTNFTIGAGDTLTVMDWANEVDYFYASNWTGVTLGARGVGPETQVAFNGFAGSNTGWLSYDHEISPAPEPATYGAIFVGVSLLGLVVYRRKRSAA